MVQIILFIVNTILAGLNYGFYFYGSYSLWSLGVGIVGIMAVTYLAFSIYTTDKYNDCCRQLFHFRVKSWYVQGYNFWTWRHDRIHDTHIRHRGFITVVHAGYECKPHGKVFMDTKNG